MKVEKAVLKYILETKSLEAVAKIKPEYFSRPIPKVLFKALQSYIGTYHKVPDVEVFKKKLEAKLPEAKQEIYFSFLDSLEDVELESSFEELLGVLKDNYVVGVVDKNIEGLVLAAQSKNVEAIRHILKKLEGDIVTEEKLPEDVRSAEYTPSKIKLIEPFLETPKLYNLKFGGLVIIGAGSGRGKSIFLLQQLMYSYEQGENVCLINLELGLDETIARMYSMATGEDFNTIYGNTNPKVIAKVNKWKEEYFDRDNKFYIRNSRFDDQEMEAVVRAMEKKGVHIFGVDYLNLVEIHTEEEWRGLTRLVKNLHRLTQELSLVILTPTQVNMTETKEKDGELKVTTRGARELELSSSVFVFIYQTKEEEDAGTARLFTLKARNAQKKTYVVETDFSHMKFKDTGMVL